MNIKTNNVPRDIIYGHELTEKEREEFDYLEGDELDCASFARYRGNLYHIGEFTTTRPGPWNHGLPPEFRNWDGYASDSFFSGVLIRYAREDNQIDPERVIFGTYYS